MLRKTLLMLSEVGQSVQRRRERCGALQLESAEVRFEFQSTDVEDIKPKEHLKIHETVAECMILANHWVAKKIAKTFPHCALLRRHPPPKRDNFEELARCAASKGWRVDTFSNRFVSSMMVKCSGIPKCTDVFATKKGL